MAFSWALFIITAFGICHHACAKAAFLMKVGQAALDVFSFGTGIVDFFLPKQDDNLKNDLLNKLDTVITNINALQQTVNNQFLELKLLIMLQKVEDFERSTESRLRKAEDIVEASDAQKNDYITVFHDGINAYLDEMYHLIPYVTETSFSLDMSILQLLQNKSNCNIRSIYDFSQYVRNLYMSGISIETMYRKHKFNSSLTDEQLEWAQTIESFDDAVDIIERYCEEIAFKKRFREDAKMTYTTLSVFLKYFEYNYIRSFLIIEVKDNEIEVSDQATHRFHCVYRHPDCNHKLCFLFHGNNTPCADMVALRIKLVGLSFYKYEISDDFGEGFAVNLDTGLDYYLPSNCFWKTRYKFYKPGSGQISTVCSSAQILCREMSIIFIAFLVFVFMVF